MSQCRDISDNKMDADLTPDSAVANECDDDHRDLESTGCTHCNVMQSFSRRVLHDIQAVQGCLASQLVAGQRGWGMAPFDALTPTARGGPAVGHCPLEPLALGYKTGTA